MRTWKVSTIAVLATASLVLAACAGSTGPQGPAGPTGSTGTTGTTGPTGTPGASVGIISGKLTATGATGGVPAISVTTIPDEGVTTITAADGSYTLANVPVGIYTVSFGGATIATTTVTGVNVVAAKTTTVNATATYSPIVLTLTPSVALPTGFAKATKYTVSATGATAAVTYTWARTCQAALPTAKWPALTAAADGTSVSLTTPALLDYTWTVLAGNTGMTLGAIDPVSSTHYTSMLIPMDASGATIAAVRPGLIGIGPSIMARGFNCTITVTATDGAYKQTATASLYPVPAQPGSIGAIQPQNTMMMAVGNANGPWTLSYSATDKSYTTSKTALIDFPSQWITTFTPADQGFYALKLNGAIVAEFQVGKYQGAINNSCAPCHNSIPALKAAVDAKWTAWNKSAHGNFYFKAYGVEGAPILCPDSYDGITPALGLCIPKALDQTIPGNMTLFAAGVNGVEGSHYSTTCVVCHTTGYKNPAALPNIADWGFSDTATKLAWAFPSNATIDYTRYNAKVTGTGTTVGSGYETGDLKKLAGIQCESCHGGISMHVNNDSVLTKPVAVWDARTCGVCHDSPSNHDRYWLWSNSGHSNYELAMNEGPAGVSCQRCHVAQGFADYVDNGLAPIAGSNNHSRNGAYQAATLLTTKATAMPQTCQACHDPHTTGLRVDESWILTLPAGFEVQGTGAGSTCFACHNTRNGLHVDNTPFCYETATAPVVKGAGPIATPPFCMSGTSAASAAIGGPHAPVQGDMMAVTNAFFVSTGMPSRHMAVKDTCVGCHVKLHPDSITPANTNHTFRADGTICKSCHGVEVNLEALEGEYSLLAGYALTSFSKVAKRALPDPFYVKSGTSYYAVSASNVASVVPAGRSGWMMTFTTPVTIGSGTVSSFTGNALSFFTSGIAPFTQVYATKGIVAKSNWNLYATSGAVAGSAANVIHNPSFAFQVITATKTALDGATSGTY